MQLRCNRPGKIGEPLVSRLHALAAIDRRGQAYHSAVSAVALNGVQVKERLLALDARLSFTSFAGFLNASLP